MSCSTSRTRGRCVVVPDSGGTRKLTVTACDPIYQGIGKTNKPYTIYEVFAVDEAGIPVEAKLRSFDALKLNALIDYEVTKREDPKHGTSYTLKKPGKPDPPPDLREMDRAITDLRGSQMELSVRVKRLEEKAEEILAFLNSRRESGDSPPPKAMQPAASGGPMAGDTGIPT